MTKSPSPRLLSRVRWALDAKLLPASMAVVVVNIRLSVTTLEHSSMFSNGSELTYTHLYIGLMYNCIMSRDVLAHHCCYVSKRNIGSNDGKLIDVYEWSSCSPRSVNSLIQPVNKYNCLTGPTYMVTCLKIV
jgi:hypothetical protein